MWLRRAWGIIAAAILCGCHGAANSNEPITIMALDTSGSAVSSHEAMFGRATEMIQEIPDGQRLYLYRFDSSPAEVYSQAAPAGTDEIASLLNDVLKHRSATNGTNLAKLVDEMDQRIRSLQKPVRIVIFTDCGIEKMTPAEIDEVRSVTSRWDSTDRVASVQMIGVADSYREPLRGMLKLDDAKLEFVK